MADLLRHSRIEVVDLHRVGREFLPLVRGRGIGDREGDLVSWLKLLARLREDRLAPSERADLDAGIEILRTLFERKQAVDQAVLTHGLGQVLGALGKIRYDYELSPSAVEDRVFLRFLGAVRHADGQLGMGAAISIIDVAKIGHMSVGRARECLTRLVSDGLGYEARDEEGGFFIDHERLDFASEDLAPPTAERDKNVAS